MAELCDRLSPAPTTLYGRTVTPAAVEAISAYRSVALQAKATRFTAKQYE